MGREPAETYVKTYGNDSRTIALDVFYDDLPVTLEDLGFPVTDSGGSRRSAASTAAQRAIITAVSPSRKRVWGLAQAPPRATARRESRTQAR